METFLQKFGPKIKGVLAGFDRIVFKGCLRHLAYTDGAARFLAGRGVLNKDYKAWMLAQSAALVAASERLALEQTGARIAHIPSLHARKEDLARARLRERGGAAGPVGVWSCTESCRTFRAAFDPGSGRPRLRPEHGKCKHLCFYHNHAEYGFMSVRLQTWFPYEAQVALNGREWPRRGLERLPLRKGVADIPFRAEVCREVNARLIGKSAALSDATTVRDALAGLGRKTRAVRALDLLGKDRALVEAVADPALASLAGVTNGALRKSLAGTAWAKGMTGQPLSARIGRNLRLLRDHGLLAKAPKQRTYHLTEKGRKIAALLPAILSASTEQLTQHAA